MVSLALIALLCPVNVFAKDDNIKYSLDILEWQKNAKVKNGRYRQTKDINNKWKVQLQSTTEGAGNGNDNITVFWLEGSNDENVTTTVSAKQGKSVYYTPAYSSASERTVYLTAEDNRITFSTYHVEGIWDEETK